MRSPVLATLLLAAVSLTSVAPAQVAPSGEGYTIRVKYVAGQVTNYKVASKIDITGGPEGMPAPGPQSTDISVRQEVVEVKDGVSTLKVETTGGPTETPTQTFQVDEHGKVVGQPEGTPPGQNMSGFPTGLPDRALKVGETWSSETEMPGIPGGGKIKVDYTFQGLKTVEGKSVAQIDFKMSLAGEMTMDGEGTVILDPADGQLLSTTSRNTMTIKVPGVDKSMTISISLDMKRV